MSIAPVQLLVIRRYYLTKSIAPTCEVSNGRIQEKNLVYKKMGGMHLSQVVLATH